MSDIQGSDSRVDRPRDEGIIVSPVLGDRKEKQEYSKEPSGSPKNLLIAAFFTCLKKLFDSLSGKSKFEATLIDRQQILEDLFAFRKLLQILSQEDQSNNPEFTLQLSELWHNLLDDFNHVELLERKNPKKVAPFKKFLNKVKDFPPNQDHRLGYYLTEYVGKEWLPFPYIEILRKLHKDYQTNPAQNALQEWLSIIDEVVAQLAGKRELP